MSDNLMAEEGLDGAAFSRPRIGAKTSWVASATPCPSHKINEETLNILTLMSHDIRGPLTSVAAGLKLLEKGAYGSMSKGAEREVRALFAMVQGLIGSAEDFMARAFSVDGGLDISKEPLHVEEDVVSPVLLELSREIQQRSMEIEKNLSAIPSEVFLMQGDRFWMKAILRNLLKNALKYGIKGGKIVIGLENLLSHIKMNVFNTGRPIPEEDRNVLFTRFGRIGSKENQSVEGMGLGLYLVKEIVEGYGGHVWYEAMENGSNFVFILPRT